MFEDQDQQEHQPQAQPPSDMFADVEKPSALGSGRIRPVQMPPVAQPLGQPGPSPMQPPVVPVQPAPIAQAPLINPMDVPEIKEPFMRKGKFIILGVVLLGIIGGAVYMFYRKVNSNPVPPSNTPVDLAPEQPVAPTTQNPPSNDQSAPTPTQPTDDVVAPPPPPTVLPETPKDSDQDGLTDVEEAELGTDSFAVDSDKDGLTDKEEVLLWKTDPLNPDSDGDGYKDGEEVSHGYRPDGPGKLFQ